MKVTATSTGKPPLAGAEAFARLLVAAMAKRAELRVIKAKRERMRYSEILAELLGLIIRGRIETGCADNGDKTKDPRGCCRKKGPNAPGKPPAANELNEG